MKILVLSNTIPKIISDLIDEKENVYGGWINGFIENLLKKDNIELIILSKGDFNKEGVANNIKYYVFKQSKVLEDLINENLDVDVIHIFGTEYKHSYDMISYCIKLNIIAKVVVNIQGLMSSIGKYHYFADLPPKVINKFTFREFIFRDNINNEKKYFVKSGEREIFTIENINHIIGRTTWDHTISKQINENINYYHNEETLRTAFYSAKKWNIKDKSDYTIFVSSSSYPLKGFHYLLEALPKVIKKYPKTNVRVIGKDVLNLSLKDKIIEKSYSKYIRHLINIMNLNNNIVFLNNLNEELIIKEYLNAHLFICPSSIENSSNSICEAMLLGTPVIASSVGGSIDLIENNVDGLLYQHNDPDILSSKIIEIFSNNDLSNRLSRNSILKGEKRQDMQNNTNDTYYIYEQIILSNK